MKILLTGATGFVGKALAATLVRKAECILTCALRQPSLGVPGKVVVTAELDDTADWSAAVADQDVVIHAAARAHVMNEEMVDPLEEYRRVNVRGTLRLARQAAEAGVSRFVFVSSIKVNGEQTQCEAPFTADDVPAPEDAYGLSKLEAELGLQQLASETGMEVVVIRPPLVYGPGVKGNFATLIRLIDKGLPLPLGAVRNKRSLVALDNLVDLIIRCADHPAAANQVFLVSDGEDLSTTQLLRGVALAQDKAARLVPIPSSLLMLGAGVIGKKALAQRVLGCLQVDIAKTRNLLAWQPPLTLEDGLERCFIVRQNK